MGKPEKRKTNWHALVFYGTLWLTTVCVVCIAAHPERRLETLLEDDARRRLVVFVHRLAGWPDPPREGQIFNAQVPASPPRSLHAH